MLLVKGALEDLEQQFFNAFNLYAFITLNLKSLEEILKKKIMCLPAEMCQFLICCAFLYFAQRNHCQR